MRSVVPEGSTEAKDRGILTMNNSVTPGYFQTMNIPLLRGRHFNDFDTEDKPAVAVINEATQKRFWPNEDPIGKRFNFITESFLIEVAGVVKDTVSQLGQPPQPTVYLPAAQRFPGAAVLLVRTSRDPALLLTDIQNAIRSLDRNVPVTDVRTMRQALANALQGPRLGAALLGIFGIMALVLAAVGIYGVMSFSVSQRTQEMGIRIALGARSGDVRSLVLRQGMLLVGVGLAVGLFLAWAASLAVRSLLFGISNLDAAAYLANVLLLVAVAFVACAIPARRATRVDPIVALRYE
jgi:putative ABC transport system permease protein